MTAPILSRTEIVVHGLADGTAAMLLGAAVTEGLKAGDPFALVQAALALLVILLSALVFARRMRPESRRLRGAEMLLSVLVGALGVAAAILLLDLMVSGATYKGDSPDAGGMTAVFSLFLYYPAAALVVLPLALKVSRLSPRLRRGLGWMVLLLVLLPFLVLTGARLAAGS
jgi:hypothetical protein